MWDFKGNNFMEKHVPEKEEYIGGMTFNHNGSLLFCAGGRNGSIYTFGISWGLWWKFEQ